MLLGVATSVLLCLTFLVSPTRQSLGRSLQTYVAAVVEYSPASGLGDVEKIVAHSIEQYEAYIEQAASQKADIIVFPECGIQGLGGGTTFSTAVPSPEASVIPCADQTSNYAEALRKLSCAAIRHNIYVVANLPEAVRCDSSAKTTCTSNVVTYYNTNVAFDRKGAVIARYRKFHLFGEPGFSRTQHPEMTMFDTDFGVRFGMFTCFDIMFDKPAVSLVSDHGITDIIFPTAWFSETPFLTAVQTQTAWAAGFDVNLLAAGYNSPRIGSTGSGIYEGRHGAVIATMLEQQKNELLVGTVHKRMKQADQSLHAETFTGTRAGNRDVAEETGGQKQGALLKVLLDDLTNYETELLEPALKNVNGDLTSGVTELAKTICHQEFCCDFNVSMAVQVSVRSAVLMKTLETQSVDHGWTITETRPYGYYYRLVAFDGVRSFSGLATGGTQVCAVVACTDRSLFSCGAVLSDNVAKTLSDTTFRYIGIKARYPSKGSAQFPNTLTSKYRTMNMENIEFRKESVAVGAEYVVTMFAENVEKNLLTFGIYGRDFTKDGNPKTQSREMKDEF